MHLSVLFLLNWINAKFDLFYLGFNLVRIFCCASPIKFRAILYILQQAGLARFPQIALGHFIEEEDFQQNNQYLNHREFNDVELNIGSNFVESIGRIGAKARLTDIGQKDHVYLVNRAHYCRVVQSVKRICQCDYDHVCLQTFANLTPILYFNRDLTPMSIAFDYNLLISSD